MRTGLKTTTVVLIVTMSAMIAIGSALAKGPESAVLSGPGLDNPIDIPVDAHRDVMTTFMEQSGLWYARGDLPTPVDAPTGDLGMPWTLTWVNSGPPSLDVELRTIQQRIYVLDGGRMLIETPAQENLADWGQSVIGWFEAPDGFAQTLQELGVDLEAAEAAAASSSVAAAPSGGGATRTVVVAVLAFAALGVTLWRRIGVNRLADVKHVTT